MDVTAFPRQYARTRRFTLGMPHAFTVSPDGERVLFLRTRSGEDPVSCLWLLAGGAERLLFDPGEPGSKEAGIAAYSADAAVRTVAFALGGGLWVAGTDGAAPRPVPTAGPAADPRLDPTGRRVAYVTGGAVHVVDTADGSDRVLAAPERPEVR